MIKQIFFVAVLFPFFLLLTFCSSPATRIIQSPGCPEPVKGGDCLGRGFIVHICSNHGHRFTGNMKKNRAGDYIIKGSADHEHIVIINGGHFFKLEKNQGIQIISTSTKGHNHTVTINCKK